MRTRRSAGEALISLVVEKSQKTKAKAATPNSATLRNRQDQRQSPFFRLSTELRNIIYEHCLPGTCEVPNPSVSNRNGGSQGPALLLTCKQAYAEGINMFYHETAFRISGGHSRMTTWLSRVALKSGHGAMLESVTLAVPRMNDPHAKIIGRTYTGNGYKRKMGPKFVDLVSSTAKRAKIKSGALKLEFRPTPGWWPFEHRQAWRGELDTYHVQRIGALQTWALTWDDSGKARMVQC